MSSAIDSDIAIIGAGIGGLATAAALAKAGAHVTVYEQAPELGEVGAGVALARSSVRFLTELGRLDAAEAVAVKVPRGMVTHAADGRELRATGYTGGLSFHRRDLLELLAETVAGVEVRTNAKAVAVTQDADSATIEFADGSTVTADAVIGADGIHSKARPAVTEPTPPTFSGMIAYRGLVPRERVPWFPIDAASLYVGPGKHFLIFPVRRAELLNFVGFVKADEAMQESWSLPGDPAVLAAEFDGWGHDVVEFIKAVDATWRWGLYDREPLPRWVNGRVALVGDAAHAMLPHASQGANNGIDDAVVLADVLRGAPDVPTALAAYERGRHARGSYIQLYSRRLGLEYDLRHDELRDRAAHLAPRDEVDAWIRGHDAHASAAAALQGVEVPVPEGAPV